MNRKTIKLPERGMNRDELLKRMKTYGDEDVNWKEGRTWSMVYHLGEEHTRFLKDAYSLFFTENALNPMAFKSLKRFEAEVIGMTAHLLHGDERTVGTMTSGGTESILLAVKTYRDLARKKKPWIRKPQMIVPDSAHVAFDKASSYFDVKAVHVPLDETYRVDINMVKRFIDKNTILLVGSAPSYPHGMIDPIEELGRIALKKGIPLHVDSCLGGFLLPFVERLSYNIPRFDFRVQGVTSMSADLHKYGYGAKGASTLLYRSMDLLKHQFFVYENWPGGIFASSGILGTRPGGSIAAAWAAMHSLGEEGYRSRAQIVMETTEKLILGINSIPELTVLGRPPMSVFAYTSRSKQISIYAVGDQMEKRGWHIDRLQRPPALHAVVTPIHKNIIEAYLSDLRDSVAYVRRNPALAEGGTAAIYGMIAQLPLRAVIKKKVQGMMEDMYGAEGETIDLRYTRSRDKKENSFKYLSMKLGLLVLRMVRRVSMALRKRGKKE